MNDGITYNVKTTVNSNTTNEKELREIFNAKLLKIIISFEKSNRDVECQI